MAATEHGPKARSIYSLLLYRSRWIPGKLGFHIPQALVAPLPFDHVILSVFEIIVPKGAYKFPFSGDFRRNTKCVSPFCGGNAIGPRGELNPFLGQAPQRHFHGGLQQTHISRSRARAAWVHLLTASWVDEIVVGKDFAKWEISTDVAYKMKLINASLSQHFPPLEHCSESWVQAWEPRGAVLPAGYTWCWHLLWVTQ